MEIKSLSINNFRGIKSLTWEVNSKIVCLIGPGDSTKSTILSAIALLFSPRWNVLITDLDFYNLNVEEPVKISAVITDFPEEFSKDHKYGLHLGLWNEEDGFHVDEKEKDCIAMKICFSVDKSLEPKWIVRNIDTDEEKNIPASDREKLFVAELGFYSNRDLSWGRYSALTKITGGKSIQNSTSSLADISRFTRSSFDPKKFAVLNQTASELEPLLVNFGYEPKGGLIPGLDPKDFSINSNSITLIDGEIPLNASGMGTRRLATMAIYHAIAEEGAVFLVDEVETGFEPFRLKKLLKSLQKSHNSQSFLTTHSVIPILELADQGLFIVRNNEGVTTISPLDKELTPYARSVPEGLLARKIIVCEGKTEEHLLGSMVEYWAKDEGNLDFGTSGVEVSYHKAFGGSSAPKLALLLQDTGYTVAYFGDSDKVTNPSIDALSKAGVEVVVWSNELFTEQRICEDLPLEGLLELIDLAVECETKESDLVNRIKLEIADRGLQADNLKDLITQVNPTTLRKVLGGVLNKLESFKKNSSAISLGKFLIDYLDEMKETDTYKKIDHLIRWADENPD